MKVDIKAISDALDGILAAEGSAAPQKTHSAIINRQRPLVSHSNNDTPHSEGLKSVASKAAEAPFSHHTTGAAGGTGSIIKPSPVVKKPTTPEKTSAPQLQASASDGITKERPMKKAARKNRSPQIVRSQDQRSLPPLNPAWKNTDSIVADFLALLGSIELVAFKVVEATGVGVESALVTPQNVGRWISRCALPSKSWVTSTPLSCEACVLLELENRADIHRRRRLPPCALSSGSNQLSGGSTDTYVVQDYIAVLVLEDDVERRLHHLDPPAFPIQEQYLLNVVIETSTSAHGAFVALVSTPAAPSRAATLRIPGTLLKAFVRITICPTESDPSRNVIKVRALCFFRSDTWTAEEVAVAQKDRMPFEEEVKATLRESMTAACPKAHSDCSSKQERVAGETLTTDESSLPLAKDGQERIGEGITHHTSLEQNTATEVASFVKAVALSRSRQDSMAPRRSCLRGVGEVEYDWFLDTLIDVSTAKGAKVSASNKASTAETDSEEGVVEYIRTLQAWNNVPTLSVKAALSYCLSETTSFSASTLLATGLFGHEAQEHLSQPFKLHVLVVSISDSTSQDSTQTHPPGVYLPPLHLISAIASEAVSLGYSTELLFTCPTNNGFGCAIRPYSCTPVSQEAHYKLIFVVPVRSTIEGEECSAAGVMKSLLRIALSLFCDSSDMRVYHMSPEYGLPSHGTLQSRKPCGALRLLIDGTRCFDDLMPVLAEWAAVSGGLRYYGNVTQRTLQLLFFPSCFIGSGADGELALNTSELRHEAQWSSLRLRFSGLWRKDTKVADCVADDIVGLAVDYQRPATYVWQSRRGALRLVLTDTHFIEYLTYVDGLVAPSPLVSLATSYYGEEARSAAHHSKLSTFSEAPWMALLQAAERLHEGSVESTAEFSKDAAVDFFALRRRVTVSFAFHILSTAFKRGWTRVSASIPLCDGSIRDAASDLQSVRFHPLEETTSDKSSASSPLSLLDEDAFIDTLLQWQYPFPNVVVLHCTDVLRAGLRPPSAYMTAPRASCLRAREGVLSLFSEGVLQTFASVSKPDEALS
ncbi:hypothetical protein LSCM1_01866 [Leishmania martiniquensis]|uniref:Uncharacterized protein n=1 Tax=Leishmania martiniquensis TaxID=1580590 RepID=A0A836H579_9TRYP|nr:hypothetical protein LSCM1_01866 [Leishmania martiniquensis]